MASRDIYETGFDEETGKTTSGSICPECEGKLITESGEIRCIECGLIIDEQRLAYSQGPRSFNSDGDSKTRKRTGAPLTPARHDRGLSSEIGFGGDAKGKPLSPEKRRRIARMRREHTRARWETTAARNLAHACGEIARMTSALELPRAAREEASVIYRRAQAENLIVGRSIEAIAAGSLYAACRCRGDPRMAEEIASVAHCNQQKVELGYRVLNVELDLKTQVIGVRDRLHRLAADVDASDQIQHRALELARQAEEAGLNNGRNPAGVAAACLYLAGREFDAWFTQAGLAGRVDVSPSTLRARYQELRAQVDST